MDEQEILTRINNIFITVLKRNDVALSMSSAAADIDGWDSLTHMIIIDTIEKQFSVKFKLMEVMKFNNVGDIVACIRKKLN